jgi:hypothetical protein
MYVASERDGEWHGIDLDTGEPSVWVNLNDEYAGDRWEFVETIDGHASGGLLVDAKVGIDFAAGTDRTARTYITAAGWRALAGKV